MTDEDCATNRRITGAVLTVTIGDTGSPLTVDGVRHLLASQTVQIVDLMAAEITDEARVFVERSAAGKLIQVNLPDETMSALLREGYSLAMIRQDRAR